MFGSVLQFGNLINAVDRILIKEDQDGCFAPPELKLQCDGFQVFFGPVFFVFMTVDGNIYLFSFSGDDIIQIDDTGVVFAVVFFHDEQFSFRCIDTDDLVA